MSPVFLLCFREFACDFYRVSENFSDTSDRTYQHQVSLREPCVRIAQPRVGTFYFFTTEPLSFDSIQYHSIELVDFFRVSETFSDPVNSFLPSFREFACTFYRVSENYDMAYQHPRSQKVSPAWARYCTTPSIEKIVFFYHRATLVFVGHWF